jgi:hypothetical protein
MRNNELPSADAGVDHGLRTGTVHERELGADRAQPACLRLSLARQCSGRGAVAMSQLARQGAPNLAANRVGVR